MEARRETETTEVFSMVLGFILAKTLCPQRHSKEGMFRVTRNLLDYSQKNLLVGDLFLRSRTIKMERTYKKAQKVSSNSKHTLLCLCGHNILARIKPNTIVLSHHKILVVSVLGSVLAYTLGKGCVLLVESSEQGLVFGAKLNYESCMAKPKLTQNGEI